ncbi:MAG: ArsR family transcriptional regulator [Anaerolineae bacterium]|nr:ArsR family transcriptional regulator [Anaerolineae bacterium]
MQQTRQYILDILSENGEATVDEIVAELHIRRGKLITPVTVRHHINLLQAEELVTSPELRRRTSPGRPQHVYALTDKARDHFPHNFERLITGLVRQIEQTFPAETVNVIFEGVADQMADDVPYDPSSTLEDRLTTAVEYMSEHGYNADWEACDEGFILHTRNCPYHPLAETTSALCAMDMRLVSSLLGVVPRLISHVSNGDRECSFLIPSFGE